MGTFGVDVYSTRRIRKGQKENNCISKVETGSQLKVFYIIYILLLLSREEEVYSTHESTVLFEIAMTVVFLKIDFLLFDEM